MNRVVIVGRACADPESRNSANGNTFCKLRMAIDGRSKDDTLFTTVTIFGKQAEVTQKYVTKGRQVLVEGRLQEDRWEDENGKTRTNLSIIGERIEFLGGPTSPKKEEEPVVAGASEENKPF